MKRLKRQLYFVAAGYFVFWARIVLWRWKPRIIVLTGSSGKTTLLHLIEAQLGNQARYSYMANSSFGIPFDILGLSTNISFHYHWFAQVLRAPFGIFRTLPQQSLYIVEADCDRPHEGEFLARFLRPEVTLWVSLSHTHAQNFDRLVGTGKTFVDHGSAIAYEFGWFAAHTQKLVVIEENNQAMTKQLPRIAKGVDVQTVSLGKLVDYSLGLQGTTYVFNNHRVVLPGLQPRSVVISLQMVEVLLRYLDITVGDYNAFTQPPGRSSVFRGIRTTTLIDSSYNTGLSATLAMLDLFSLYPSQNKWLVLGDMLEQGKLEQSEHAHLAEAISKLEVKRLILVGPRVKQHVMSIVQQKVPGVAVVWFDGPKEALDYLNNELSGGEAILFKGARFLEGIIEQLLADPTDAEKLPRRGAVWQKRRQKWGLPK